MSHTHSKGAERAIIESMAHRMGLRAPFVAEYLARHNLQGLDLSRAVYAALNRGNVLTVTYAVIQDKPLPDYQP